VSITSGKALKRKLLQALMATVIGGAGILATAQPAQAAVVIEPGASGHACSAYQNITSTLYFQACAWASGGSTPRVWFTGHFGNRGDRAVTIAEVRLGSFVNTRRLNCPNIHRNFTVPAGGVKATNDQCYYPRESAAYQAWVWASYGGSGSEQWSPTIQVL